MPRAQRRRDHQRGQLRPADRSDRGWRVFARNVAANVVANLIAAAVIYVAAVLGGYLRANPVLLAVAGACVIIAALAWVGMLAFERWPGHDRLIFWVMFILGGVMGSVWQAWLKDL